jgi:CheY-like chemotaxis protein
LSEANARLRAEAAEREQDESRSTSGVDSKIVGENPVVLLVEHELQVRMVLAEALREFRYQVLEVSSGLAALRVLHDRLCCRVDLITEVDLSGDLNGLQMAEAARTMKPELPVLFITAEALDEHA